MTLKMFLFEGFSCTEYSLLTAGAFLAAAPNSATLRHIQEEYYRNRRKHLKPVRALTALIPGTNAAKLTNGRDFSLCSLMPGPWGVHHCGTQPTRCGPTVVVTHMGSAAVQ